MAKRLDFGDMGDYLLDNQSPSEVPEKALTPCGQCGGSGIVTIHVPSGMPIRFGGPKQPRPAPIRAICECQLEELRAMLRGARPDVPPGGGSMVIGGSFYPNAEVRTGRKE